MLLKEFCCRAWVGVGLTVREGKVSLKEPKIEPRCPTGLVSFYIPMIILEVVRGISKRSESIIHGKKSCTTDVRSLRQLQTSLVMDLVLARITVSNSLPWGVTA